MNSAGIYSVHGIPPEDLVDIYAQGLEGSGNIRTYLNTSGGGRDGFITSLQEIYEENFRPPNTFTTVEQITCPVLLQNIIDRYQNPPSPLPSGSVSGIMTKH